MQTSETPAAPSGTDLAERRRIITDALRGLPLLPNVEASGRLQRAIDTLVLVCAPALPRRRPNAFIKGTEGMRAAELAGLVKIGTAMADALDGLHGGAIDALGVSVGGLNLIEALSGRAGKLNLLDLADLARTLAHAAKTAPLPPMSKSGRGAAEKPHARGITRVARAEYVELTGREATYTKPPDQRIGKPSGPFFDLLNILYAVAGIQASAEWQIKSLPVKVRVPADLTPFAGTEGDG